MKDLSKLEWTETDSKVILHTRVFDVTERTSLSPEGKKGTYIVNNAPDWAIIIPVYEDNFLMVKQWRHGEKKVSIEFPGGVIEKGEDIQKGIERELLEETGAVAKKITKLAAVNPNPALFSNHVHIFCAEDLTFTGKQNLDEDEYLNCIKIPQEKVISEMGSSEYPHALMMAALFAWLRYKNENK